MIVFFGGSFEDMGIFHVFQLSFDGGGVISTHNRYIDNIREKCPYLQTTTVITFSIVFTNKNGGGGSIQPPSSHQN